MYKTNINGDSDDDSDDNDDDHERFKSKKVFTHLTLLIIDIEESIIKVYAYLLSTQEESM